MNVNITVKFLLVFVGFFCAFSGVGEIEISKGEQSRSQMENDVVSSSRVEDSSSAEFLEILKEVENQGKFQFAARLSDGDYLCLSYPPFRPNDGSKYYFLFRESKLEKVVAAPTHEVDLVPYQDSYLGRRRPLNPAKRLEMVLDAESVGGSQVVEQLELLRIEEEQQKKQNKPENLSVAWKLLRPFFDKKTIDADYQRNDLLAKRFDPLKVRLGDAEDLLFERFDNPLDKKVNRENETILYLFGSNERLKVNPRYRFSNIFVATKNGIVTRVFSNDFYHSKYDW